MFYMPSPATGDDWGANVKLSPVRGAPSRRPDRKLELYTLCLVPVEVWSDGSPAKAHGSP